MSPVVEKLLPYLDATSTLHLLQSGISCLKQHLQRTSVVWMKIVNRTLPPGEFKIVTGEFISLQDFNNRTREAFEEKRIQLASLINLLKMLDKPNSHILQLLDVICQKSPPNPGWWEGIPPSDPSRFAALTMIPPT